MTEMFVDGCEDLNEVATRASAITITVHGEPAGQGQVTFLGKGRGAKHTNEKRLKPWRRAIIDAALAVTGGHEFAAVAASVKLDTPCARCRVRKGEHAVLVGVPVRAEITVTVEKPKSAPKRTETWPITRHSTDADHHARAMLDALSIAGVFLDDSQVVDLACRKFYPGQHPDTLDTPGAVIRVRPIGGVS